MPADWAGPRVLLHFQAVDHDATVWVDGVEVGRHRGGFTPFTVDLGGARRPGATAVTIVRARPRRPRTGPQARGKQSGKYAEQRLPLHAHDRHLADGVDGARARRRTCGRPRITPDVAASAFRRRLPLSANRPGAPGPGDAARREAVIVVAATVRADLDLAPDGRPRCPGRPASGCGRPRIRTCTTCAIDCSTATAPWSTRVDSYAGLRSVAIDGQARPAQRRSPSSSGSCSTRATTRTA